MDDDEASVVVVSGGEACVVDVDEQTDSKII